MATKIEKITQDLKLLENYINKYYPTIKGHHFDTLIDVIFMATVRNNINIPTLLHDLYNGIIDVNKYMQAKNGNIYNFINEKYRGFAERLKNITVGSNSGGANIGKGEWLISLGCGIDPTSDKPYAIIKKDGGGDLKIAEKNEEIKWNGGRVSVEKAGNQVNKIFNDLIDIPDKKWVPFRDTDKRITPLEEINRNNSIYWQAISGEIFSSLSDDELKKKIINLSFVNIFKKNDSFIMFNDDGKFNRFHSVEDANTYYYDKLPILKGAKCGFECRANQPNPIALYCYVF